MAKSRGLRTISLCDVCTSKSATFVSSISLCSPTHEIASSETAEFGVIEGQDNSSVRGWLLAKQMYNCAFVQIVSDCVTRMALVSHEQDIISYGRNL